MAQKACIFLRAGLSELCSWSSADKLRGVSWASMDVSSRHICSDSQLAGVAPGGSSTVLSEKII